jgi:hypothetical protein
MEVIAIELIEIGYPQPYGAYPMMFPGGVYPPATGYVNPGYGGG